MLSVKYTEYFSATVPTSLQNIFMYKTDEFIANRLLWRAERHQLPTEFSFFVKDLLPSIQEYITSLIDNTISGQPVLLFTKPSNEWTLVCTRQVIFSDNSDIHTLGFADIQKFSPIFINPLNGRLLKDKAEWDQITVYDKYSNPYILHANKGRALFALWDILLMAVHLLSNTPTDRDEKP